MQWELREYAQNRLKTNPNNGAAAKFLAIDMAETYSPAPDEMWPLLETAMRFLPNDIDICFLAFEKSGFDFLKEKAVISLERLFERLNGMAHKLAIDWVWMCCYDYFHVTARPCDFHKHFESTDPLLPRWEAVMRNIQVVLEKQLESTPHDWNTISMLLEHHETLGNSQAGQSVLENAQIVFEKRLERDANDWDGLHGLAKVHEKW